MSVNDRVPSLNSFDEQIQQCIQLDHSFHYAICINQTSLQFNKIEEKGKKNILINF